MSLEMGTVVDVGPVLGRLPLEVREEIYENLLGRHTRHEHNMRSDAYNKKRNSVLRGGDYTLDLGFSILRVNHQIQREALDVFQRGHTFVRLYAHDINVDWLSVLDPGIVNASFLETDITLIYDSPQDRDSESIEYIFPVEELGSACAKICEAAYTRKNTTLRIQVGPRLANGNAMKLKQVLKPFEEIRGNSTVSVEGFDHTMAFDGMIALICHGKPNAAEVMRDVAIRLGSAEESSCAGQHLQAIKIYKEVLNIVRGSSYDWPRTNPPLQGGIFDGVTPGYACKDTEIRAHSWIAMAYLSLGKPRMARIYVERECRSLRTFDKRLSNGYFPLPSWYPMPHDDANAKLFTTAARISRAHGSMAKSKRESVQAQRIDPQNPDAKTFIDEHWEWRLGEIHRSDKKNDARSKKQDGAEKLALQLSMNRVIAAEHALNCGKIRTAKDKYKAAVRAAKQEDDSWYHLTDEKRQLHPRIAVLANRLGEHQDAVYWSHVALWRGFPEQSPEYPKIMSDVYCEKALAYEALGSLEEAIETLCRGMDEIEICDGTFCDERLYRELRRLSMVRGWTYVHPLDETVDVMELFDVKEETEETKETLDWASKEQVCDVNAHTKTTWDPEPGDWDTNESTQWD